MSFSVHARAFVPASAAALSPSELREPAAAAALTKDCVCVAFYENGRCPYGNHCEHAHRFSELSQSTQAKLLGSVPVESIPPHFFGAAQAKGEMMSALDAAVPKAFTAYGRFSPIHGAESEPTVSTRRRPPGKDRHLIVSHLGPQTPVPDTGSVSSRTSSSTESQQMSNSTLLAKGTPSSSSKAVAATPVAETASFRMHLPLRCRYPHPSIPGTYYDVLALPRAASHEDIIAKYRAWQKEGFKRMRVVDPVGAEAVDRMIVESRNVLGNPFLRAAYDQQLPSTLMKPQPWQACSGAGGTASASTTPSKHRTQGQSSTASSTSEANHKLDSSHNGLDHCSSSSSIYHADHTAPVVTISSLHNGDSIW